MIRSDYNLTINSIKICVNATQILKTILNFTFVLKTLAQKNILDADVNFDHTTFMLFKAERVVRNNNKKSNRL